MPSTESIADTVFIPGASRLLIEKTVKAILMEAASLTDNEDFDEMVQTLNADDYISTISEDTKADYSSDNSMFAFLGTPGDTGT